jgi:hypothetical protein
MKDLIEIILKGLAAYLPVLVSIVATPRQSIRKLINDEPEVLNRALSFCGLTLAIGFALQAPLAQSEQSFTTFAGSLLALRIIAVVTFAGFIVMFFRLVGGKGDYQSTLCACLYITSPVYLFLVVTSLIMLGIITHYDPGVAATWRSGQPLSEEQLQAFVHGAPTLAIGFLFLMLLQLLISIAWFMRCWGVYREIHAVSRLRSVLVYLLTIALWYLYWVSTLLVLKGLNGGLLPPIG